MRGFEYRGGLPRIRVELFLGLLFAAAEIIEHAAAGAFQLGRGGTVLRIVIRLRSGQQICEFLFRGPGLRLEPGGDFFLSGVKLLVGLFVTGREIGANPLLGGRASAPADTNSATAPVRLRWSEESSFVLSCTHAGPAPAFPPAG